MVREDASRLVTVKRVICELLASMCAPVVADIKDGSDSPTCSAIATV